MPTYAYRCAECGHRFETVQSFTDEALTVCPVCNGVLRKVFNAVGVVFKGSGFYRTDSRAAALASSGNGSEAKGNGTDAKKSDKGAAKDTSTSSSSANGAGSNGSSNGSSSNGSAANGSSSKSGASTGSGTGSKAATG